MYGSGEALYGERLYTEEEEAVYVINIHGRTVQWESRKTSCSIINIYIYHIFKMARLPPQVHGCSL